MTLEEKKAKVMDLRPIDDVFFEVLASNKKVCRGNLIKQKMILAGIPVEQIEAVFA